MSAVPALPPAAGRQEKAPETPTASSPAQTVRACVRQLDYAVRAARTVGGWAIGLPGRMLGKEAAVLVRDAATFAVVDLPPVLYGRAVDLPGALIRMRPKRSVFSDPAGAAALAARTGLDVMGGGFVKLAQVIAHSPALFPEPLVKACRGSLASAVTPPARFEELVKIITSELGVEALAEVFESFEPEPMASASIAQVHAATLSSSGERCVVKVVRPHARERLAVDFTALLLVARFVDLVLGEDVVLQFLSAPLGECVEELRTAVLDECDLGLERRNMDEFREWLLNSKPLRRAGLQGSVRVPRTFPHASAARVLTMERVDGAPLSDVCERYKGDRDWQLSLVRALSVAALAVVDEGSIFHADLHSGNMLVEKSPNGAMENVVFIDFGCCGRIPTPLRSALLMQASAFTRSTSKPDVKQFCKGFSYALQRLPGLAHRQIDSDALAEDLKPVLADFRRANPFRPGADPVKDSELHALVFRLQWVLHKHGVQLPREFTLLLKTGCFGALYFSLLDAAHRKQLARTLAVTGAAYVFCHPLDARQILSPGIMAALMKLLNENDNRPALVAAVAPHFRHCAAVCVTASVPVICAALYFLSAGQLMGIAP